MARLPGDHSQVGWLPPSYLLYHFSGTTQPCSRRENFGDFGCGTTFSGSSPLTRGKPVDHRLKRRHVGLIPAHAGKTAAQPAWLRCRRAHPRSCGENFAAVWGTLRDWGSSPLTRGKRHCRFDCDLGVGLIPAHAGKTRSTRRSAAQSSAHPRSRGENLPKDATVREMRGSSPLTRGKRTSGRSVRRSRGLIPAHTGKTAAPGRPRGCRPAHPHSHGENFPASWSIEVPPGSSPLTRGKRAPLDDSVG